MNPETDTPGALLPMEVRALIGPPEDDYDHDP
jgi:hypothetical protein